MKLASAAFAVAVLMSSLSPSAAQARTEGYASISNFQVTLTDLDPNDGIAPSLQLNPDPWLSRLSVVSADYYRHLSGDRKETWIEGDLPWDAGHVSVGYGGAQFGPATQLGADAVIRGDSLFNIELEAIARANESIGASYAEAYALSYFRTLRLSPNTHMSLTFDMTVHSVLTDPYEGAFMSSIAIAGLSHGQFQHRHDLRWDDGATGPASPDTRTYSFDYSAGSSPHDLEFAFTTLVVGWSATPVPEPHTYAMLLAGLGLIAGARRYARARPM